jgi:nucleolar protein 14
LAGKKSKKKGKEDDKAANEALLGDGLDSLDNDAQALLAKIRADGAVETDDAAGKKKQKDVDDVDDFTRVAHELALETRARAAERSKTPEEIAREEKERLEKLEHARLMRMKGLEVEEEEDGGKKGRKGRKRARNGEDTAEAGKKKEKKKSAPTDDDLVDNFAVDRRFSAVDSDDDEDNEEKEDGVYHRKLESDLPSLNNESEEDEDEDDEGDDEDEDGDDDDDDEVGAEAPEKEDDTADLNDDVLGGLADSAPEAAPTKKKKSTIKKAATVPKAQQVPCSFLLGSSWVLLYRFIQTRCLVVDD